MKRAISAVAVLMLTASLLGQGIDMDQLAAADEFRAGVVAFNNGEFANAVFSLNRSLSFKPEDVRTRFWLGRAFYYSGYEEEALVEWRWVLENGGESAFLRSRVERLEARRTLDPVGGAQDPGRYVTMEAMAGVRGENVLFRGPTMVRPRPDGSFYLVSFATHEVLLMDVNGVRRRTIDGGLEGFDQPFDLALLPDGRLLVSEFNADRIAVVDANGFKTGTFGSSGRGPDGLVGPQYLATDSRGYVYVSDYGNRRVVKFDLQGRYILHFGGRRSGSADSVGLLEPAGVACLDDKVYVADTVRGTIEVYDESGNHLSRITHPLFDEPEALSVYDGEHLLLTDANRIVLVNPERQEARQIGALPQSRRLLGAVRDVNGHILATDFSGSALLFLADAIELGLRAQIRWIDSTAFPRVRLSVAVRDHAGRSVLGLTPENFIVTEDRFPVGDETLLYGSHVDDYGAFALIVDRSSIMAQSGEAIQQAANEFLQAVGDRPRWVIPAGDPPVVAAGPQTGVLAAVAAAVGSPDQYNGARLDSAIRLAVSELYGHSGAHGIVFVTAGEISESAFATYGLLETGSLLRNAGITFSVVATDANVRSADIAYLVAESGGSWAYLYQPRGSGVVVEEAAQARPGSYVLEIRSVHESDFGRAYIPLEVRVDLSSRSGVDEAGYFGPLEF